MEESEKRRERLKAMRLEASQPGVDNVVGDPAVPHHLSNPLVETSPIPALQNNSSAPPRFDYYTDPMAAFSADKRRSKVSNQSSRDYFTPPSNDTFSWQCCLVFTCYYVCHCISFAFLFMLWSFST